MGKIIVKEDAASDAADKNLEVISTDMATATKKKSKSTVKPGSELVLASSRAVAVVNAEDAGSDANDAGGEAKGAKKPAAKKKAGKAAGDATKKASIKVVDLGGDALMEELAEAGATEGAEIDTAKDTGTAKKTTKADAAEGAVAGGAAKAPKNAKGAKGGAKSVSGMVIDGTIKPGTKGAKEAVDAEADGYALDETKLSEREKEAGDEPEFTGEPKYTKGKSALIGVGVALLVAIVGFVGIWWFSRKPTQSCIVRFEPNGGSFVNSTEMVCGNSLAKPEDPTKDGFEFQGWVYDGTPFDFENDTVRQDMILVARWTAKADTEIVRVKFDTQGGTAIEGFDIAKGKTLNAPLMPTKDGYTFDGWYLGEERFDFLTPVSAPITLVAHWKEVPKEGNDNGNNGGSGNQGPSGGPSGSGSQQRCDYLRKENASFGEMTVGVTSSALTPYIGYMSANNCKVTYRSSNEGVLKIENNSKAVAVKAGNVTLSVCVSELSGGKDLDCVKINTKVNEPYSAPEPVKVESVAVDKGGVLNLEQGKQGMINWTVYPTNATDKAVTLTSDNTSVATVGQDGTVTAVAVGTATITVKTRDGGKIATVTVTVAGTTPVSCGENQELVDGKCVDKKDPDPAPTCEEQGLVTGENGACVPKPETGGTEG